MTVPPTWKTQARRVDKEPEEEENLVCMARGCDYGIETSSCAPEEPTEEPSTEIKMIYTVTLTFNERCPRCGRLLPPLVFDRVTP